MQYGATGINHFLTWKRIVAVGKDSFPVENDSLATRNDDFSMGMNCISDLVDPQLAKMAFLG